MDAEKIEAAKTIWDAGPEAVRDALDSEETDADVIKILSAWLAGNWGGGFAR